MEALSQLRAALVAHCDAVAAFLLPALIHVVVAGPDPGRPPIETAVSATPSTETVSGGVEPLSRHGAYSTCTAPPLVQPGVRCRC